MYIHMYVYVCIIMTYHMYIGMECNTSSSSEEGTAESIKSCSYRMPYCMKGGVFIQLHTYILPSVNNIAMSIS